MLCVETEPARHVGPALLVGDLRAGFSPFVAGSRKDVTAVSGENGGSSYAQEYGGVHLLVTAIVLHVFVKLF